MFVVFEGIDGSGKTTISNRVAQRLRAGGLVVQHVREGGHFASGVTQAVRDLCRDARNVALGPRAELLLYVAREVQLIDEALAPALEQSDVVIADRYLFTADVLARHGRGLPDSVVRPILDGVAHGLPPELRQPDLVVLIDADPSVARGRRKIAKIMNVDRRPPSRKGLAGSGMQQRLREGYRDLAARDRERWMVVDNSDEDLDDVVDRVVAVVAAARAQGVVTAVAEDRRAHPDALQPAAPAPGPLIEEPKQALDAFLAWVDRRARREPPMAAYVLAGLAGAGVDDRRLALAAAAPKVVARGLKGMTDGVSWQLRRQLAGVAPREVALSLAEAAGDCDEAWRLRHDLAHVAPIEIALGLQGIDGDAAWGLRDRLWSVAPDAVAMSAALLVSPRAWQLRERWLAERGGLGASLLAGYDGARVACRMVTGLDDDRAWEIRKAAWAGAPVVGIISLRGAGSDRAWAMRERYLERAPKAVLSTIVGVDDPRAWAMREAMAPRCREALDSLLGLDHPIAWRIRESCLDVWPSTVVKSLGALVGAPRGHELLRRALGRHPESISLLKQAAAVALGGTAGADVMAA
jgi:dTMP kinase